ncbi:NAD(P)-dependent oxidoreductase [Edaphobacter sp. HDX4]|uniref:NAD(P)-dependent oxidoreductase n=1 Tax=Edaphobacter sp. HDX4 TaxID=2794064 RepID=UPI002FE5348F
MKSRHLRAALRRFARAARVFASLEAACSTGTSWRRRSGGADAVLSAFGPTTLRRTHLRRDFGRTLVQAMRSSGVDRLIHVSTAFLFGEGGLVFALMSNTLFRNVTKDHSDGEQEMRQPDLAWTMLRPPRLLDGPATGKARVLAGHLPKGAFTISRADVASFMLQEAESPRYVRQVVGLSN